MDVSQGVIDSVHIRFLKRGKDGASNYLLAKIIVTNTGKIEIFSLENDFPPILLKAANIVKPERPRIKSITWISLDIIQNPMYLYVNIQVKTPSELDKLYDTLMIAWSPKNSDNANDDNSISAAPVDVPPPKKKKSDQVNIVKNRPAKRKEKNDVIVIDDEDEPVAERRADEESAPSPEVAQLQQQLKQSGKKLQKLCDVAPRDKKALKAEMAVEPTSGVDAQVNMLNNRPAKRKKEKDVIVIDDAEEPPMKKKADEESVQSSEVAELRQQLKQSDEKFQKLCNVARRDKEALKAKLEHLETIIDSKEGILKNTNKDSVEDELKKQLDEVSRELEEERKRSAEQQLKLAHSEVMKKKVDELTNKLQEERNRSKKKRKRSKKKLSEMSKELEEERDRSANQNEEMSKLKRQLEREQQLSIELNQHNELIKGQFLQLTQQLQQSVESIEGTMRKGPKMHEVHSSDEDPRKSPTAPNEPPATPAHSTESSSVVATSSRRTSVNSAPTFDPSLPPPVIVPPVGLVIPDCVSLRPSGLVSLVSMTVPPPPLPGGFFPPPELFFGLQSTPAMLHAAVRAEAAGMIPLSLPPMTRENTDKAVESAVLDEEKEKIQASVDEENGKFFNYCPSLI